MVCSPLLGAMWAIITTTLLSTVTLTQPLPQPQAQSLTSLGLPRAGHCALSFNDTLYIFGGNATTSDLSLAFAHPIDLHAPATDWLNVGNKAIHSACAVTRGGQAVFLGSLWNRTLDLQTLQWADISSQADEATLSAMANTSQQALASFEDQLIIFGGISGDQATQTTIVLDTSTPSFWSLQTIQPTDETPLPAAGAAMAATSRWVFHFATSLQNSTQGRPYTVKVHCYDPLLTQWVGQVSEFTSWAGELQVLALPSNRSAAAETLLIVSAASQSNTSQTSTQPEPPFDMWLFTVSGNESSPATQIAWVPPAENTTWVPLAGGTATLVDTDLVVFYGGVGANGGNALRFWNTTARSFVQQPNWLNHPNPASQPTQLALTENSSPLNTLAIVLGSVLGAAVLVLLILLFLLLRRRKRATTAPHPPNHLPRLSPIALDSEPNQDVGTWALQLRQSLSTIQPSPSMPAHASRSPSVKTRSDRSGHEPLPPDPHDDQTMPVAESRFKEHFDAPLLFPSTSQPNLAPRNRP